MILTCNQLVELPYIQYSSYYLEKYNSKLDINYGLNYFYINFSYNDKIICNEICFNGNYKYLNKIWLLYNKSFFFNSQTLEESKNIVNEFLLNVHKLIAFL